MITNYRLKNIFEKLGDNLSEKAKLTKTKRWTV
jgi:hypothetical protein